MLEELTGKKVLITGASRGIGRAIASSLAEEGCHLALLARNKRELEATAKGCRKSGVEVVTLLADITDDAALKEAIDAGIKGLSGIDVLVNNAGLGHVSSPFDADPLAWAQVVDVNLRAVMNCTRLVLPALRRSKKSPAIVFIASISSKITYPGGAAYCAAKHGIAGFAGALFEDVRPFGIRVSSIMPGWVNTDLIDTLPVELDKNLIMQPDDVADAVRFVLRFGKRGCPTEIVLRNVAPPYT